MPTGSLQDHRLLGDRFLVRFLEKLMEHFVAGGSLGGIPEYPNGNPYHAYPTRAFLRLGRLTETRKGLK